MSDRYRCIVSVPVEIYVTGRDHSIAKAQAMSAMRNQSPDLNLADGQRFGVTLLAIERDDKADS